MYLEIILLLFDKSYFRFINDRIVAIAPRHFSKIPHPGRVWAGSVPGVYDVQQISKTWSRRIGEVLQNLTDEK